MYVVVLSFAVNKLIDRLIGCLTGSTESTVCVLPG